MGDIAEVIGRHLDLPVRAVPAAEVQGHVGGIEGLASDSPAANDLPREQRRWEPTHGGLLADLDAVHDVAGQLGNR